MPKCKEKVVIIGAGPAGLTMAYELLTKGKDKYDVIVLEETFDIGGISKTVKYNGNRMDIGGHRFFSKDERVMNFWKELMPIQGKDSIDDKILNRKKELPEGGPDPEKEDNVMLLRHRVSRIYYLEKFFDYPVSMKIETFKNMGLGRTIKAGFSYLKTIFVKREEKSLEDFYINRFGKVLYSMFFEKYTEKLWGRHPSEISADWGAQRVKGISIAAVIKDIAKDLPFRDFITVGLLVDKLNLENKTDIKTLGNIVPDCWIYVQEPQVKMCRIQIFNNWSPYLVKDIKNKVWIGLEYTCTEGDEYWNMPNNEFIDFAINELVSMNIISKEQVEDSHCEKIKKAYPAYFDTYKDIDKLVEYINKIDNLYCIGRNGQHRYNNMDHSMVTGMEAAENIIIGKVTKENIWNVNVEKEYHEIKNEI